MPSWASKHTALVVLASVGAIATVIAQYVPAWSGTAHVVAEACTGLVGWLGLTSGKAF